MTRTLVRHRSRTEAPARHPRPGGHARDGKRDPGPDRGRERQDREREGRERDREPDRDGLQERMLTPLYEAVYERLDVGTGTRLLSLGHATGPALLLAAARGARVTGVDGDPERLALARPSDGVPYDLVTAFAPAGCASEGGAELAAAVRSAAGLAARGGTVVLTGWGPPERCAAAPVLRVAGRLSGRDDLEELAVRAGLNPNGSGRVACPFAYPDLGSAVRALTCTGLLDAAVRATGRARVEREAARALRPHRRGDGTVWLPNVFRYLVCAV
ncbi:class I SAM-dependent methyltransferase [Streptomyces sp. NPDC059913]|uniref:class I SAM-dependent methyltransferase n=1 Tax=unclassified Streptomyces TaxID=2593676 RepID=UPI0036531B36